LAPETITLPEKLVLLIGGALFNPLFHYETASSLFGSIQNGPGFSFRLRIHLTLLGTMVCIKSQERRNLAFQLLFLQMKFEVEMATQRKEE